MAQPQISIRALDVNHDPIYGNGQNNFLNDIQAVAQIIQTTLLLFEGEWWADLTAGVPMFQSILGSSNARNNEAITLALQNAILSVDFVTGVQDIVTTYSTNRKFTFNCIAETTFGFINIQFQPGAIAVLPV
jgi:hypothetical protein